MKIRSLIFASLLLPLVAVAQNPLVLLAGSPPSGGAYSGTPDLFWWKGNTGTGTSDTATVGGVNLTLSTSAIWSTSSPTSPGGDADYLKFNGTNQSASSASTLNYASNNRFTVEFRFYQTNFNTATRQTYAESSIDWASNSGRWAIYNDTDSNFAKIMIVQNDGAANSSYYSIPRPATSTWHHIAVVFDWSSNSAVAPVVYLNGSAVTVTAEAVSWTTNTTPSTQILYIGARNNASQWVPASMKDFRIFAGARSAGNILLDATDYP